MCDLLLRWSLGDYDTTTRAEMSDEKYYQFVRMTKLSVYSFQKFFDAEFLVGFNGLDERRFSALWEKTKPDLDKPVTIFNQRAFKNPYPTFFPLAGVWWKWVPFRYDRSRTEISVDTDIICVSSPRNWYKWLESDIPLLIPREAILDVCEPTCGDVWQHIVLKGKTALNCGVIGQKGGIDVGERFFQLTELVDYGTYNGNFVTEQGLFNILYYSLQSEGVKHFVLPYEQNLQAKHLYNYLTNGKKVETIHFTARTKLIFNDLYEKFKLRVDQKISDIDIVSALAEWYILNKKLLAM